MLEPASIEEVGALFEDDDLAGLYAGLLQAFADG